MTAHVNRLAILAGIALFILAPPVRANTNSTGTNDLRWAQIVLEEQIFPSAGFLAMVSSFTDGSFGPPVRDDSSADIPWGTPAVGGPTHFQRILDKYGQASATARAGGTFAQTLQRKPNRPIVYHWFGAVAFITEADSDFVIGLGLRGDLLKQLASEPDLKLAAEAVIEGSRKSAVKMTCQTILHQLDDAKRKWAMDNGRTDGDTPFAVHIIDYLPGRSMPVCPERGTYRFNLVGEKPECTFHGDGS